MVQEAEKHADEDRHRREMVELKNQSDSMAYQAEKTLADLGDQVDDIQKQRVEGLISDLREAVSQEDEDRMRTVSADLQQELYKISQASYSGEQQGQASGGDGGQQGRKPGDSGVVEGEYTVE
jgi:molecular chaperone DnaK